MLWGGEWNYVPFYRYDKRELTRDFKKTLFTFSDLKVQMLAPPFLGSGDSADDPFLLGSSPCISVSLFC